MEYSVSSVQLLSRVWLFVTPWITAHQASLSITISQSSLKLTSIELVMPSSHLILCCPLFLLSPIPPSIRVFSNESTLRMRWPKYSRVWLFVTPWTAVCQASLSSTISWNLLKLTSIELVVPLCTYHILFFEKNPLASMVIERGFETYGW